MADIAAAQPARKRSPIGRFFTDQTKWTPYLFVAPFFITFAIFTLYPMLRAVIMGFQKSLGYTGQWEWVGFANYVEAFTRDPRMGTALVNFAYFTLGSLGTQLPCAFLLALLLTARALKAKGLWRTLFFIPSVLPGVTMGVIGLWFFSKTHGFANALVVALGGERIDWGGFTYYIMPQLLTIAFWQWMGNHAVFLIAGMSGISDEVIEAAIVDGATPWQRARHIVLPLLKPVFAYISITAAAGSLMNYDVPFVLFDAGGGPRNKGWFFMTHIREMAFGQFRMGYATAIGWLVFFIAIVITVVQFRAYKFRLGQEEV
ncbi:MAG: sugar ABC transporter permease [Chloroflexi bacterium]|nr:sugar ABC transporter permease [Chloroflexota bacterium]